jgi:putative protease
MPRESEYGLLEEYLKSLSDIPIDAFIIGDIGVLMLAKRICPEKELHTSTQANAVSSAACLAWCGGAEQEVPQ